MKDEMITFNGGPWDGEKKRFPTSARRIVVPLMATVSGTLANSYGVHANLQGEYELARTSYYGKLEWSANWMGYQIHLISTETLTRVKDIGTDQLLKELAKRAGL